MHKYLLTIISICIFSFSSLFSVWVLSYYFIQNMELAILFLPFGLKIGLLLHTKRKYWVAIYIADILLIMSIANLNTQFRFDILLLVSLISMPFLNYIYRYYKGEQFKRLTIIFISVFICSIINAILLSAYYNNMGFVFLDSLTGGIMMAMSCYLVWSYLFEHSWVALTASLVHSRIDFKIRHFLFYSSIFIASIYIQTGLPEQLRQFAPFCLAIPIIFLAYSYGWQGALLATIFNSIALMITKSSANFLVTDILLSLLAQMLTGILLGVGVQRQKELNFQLRSELSKNQRLSKDLVQKDENIRRDVARELHDEIGQNITAIRIHASMTQRTKDIEEKDEYAEIIEKISSNIYQTTHGLLDRLRPKSLDDLDLKEAIFQLVNDLQFSSQKIKMSIHFDINEDEISDTIKVTLFRISQEALNNIIKYANASKVNLSLTRSNINNRDEYKLVIKDNGIGLKENDRSKGFGLTGMRERISVLGGHFSIKNNVDNNKQSNGTQIIAILPEI